MQRYIPIRIILLHNGVCTKEPLPDNPYTFLRISILIELYLQESKKCVGIKKPFPNFFTLRNYCKKFFRVLFIYGISIYAVSVIPLRM